MSICLERASQDWKILSSGAFHSALLLLGWRVCFHQRIQLRKLTEQVMDPPRHCLWEWITYIKNSFSNCFGKGINTNTRRSQSSELEAIKFSSPTACWGLQSSRKHHCKKLRDQTRFRKCKCVVRAVKYHVNDGGYYMKYKCFSPPSSYLSDHKE